MNWQAFFCSGPEILSLLFLLNMIWNCTSAKKAVKVKSLAIVELKVTGNDQVKNTRNRSQWFMYYNHGRHEEKDDIFI